MIAVRNRTTVVRAPACDALFSRGCVARGRPEIDAITRNGTGKRVATRPSAPRSLTAYNWRPSRKIRASMELALDRQRIADLRSRLASLRGYL